MLSAVKDKQHCLNAVSMATQTPLNGITTRTMRRSQRRTLHQRAYRNIFTENSFAYDIFVFLRCRQTAPRKYTFTRRENPTLGVITSHLLINHVEPRDFGLYRCLGKNKMGEISGYITLHGELVSIDIRAILGSIVVSIPACHAGDRGSIPRRGGFFFPIWNH